MKKNNLRYIAYVRKSDERAERQVLSIRAQKNKIKQAFPDLNIIDWQEEEKSAFKENNRPVFNSVIERIERGEADGIVTWHTNRLSRNEVDAATVTSKVRKGIIKDLKFCSYSFENSPEGIWMLQSMLSQGQYESAKLGREVRRGAQQKISEQGEKPGSVPTGYMKVPIKDEQGNVVINPKYNKVITRTVKDPERYDLVNKMWKMLLSGAYTPRQIRKIANEDWGFTLRKTKKAGGGPISLSTVYRIFQNPFYAGYIRYLDDLTLGHHERMVTLEEFDYAQALLGKRGKPRSGVNEYAYSSLMRCGKCGCSIVGKARQKFIKSDNKIKTYVYYYCTRKSEKRICNQTKYTPLENIEYQIDVELAKYTIIPEFRDLALKILRRNNKHEMRERSKIYGMLQKNRNDVQHQLDKLIDMRTRDLLDDEEYISKRNALKKDVYKIDEQLRDTEKRADDWLELTEKAFNFATYARIHFRNGNLQKKREILMTLGQNLVLMDNQLLITPNEWLVPIGKEYPRLFSLYEKVRTNKKASSTEKEEAFSQIFESWRVQWDLNPRHPA